jgi:hypothetical protein
MKMFARPLLMAVTITRTVDSFSPCPPPRFDTFGETLVRSWTTPEDTKLPVEEVMRSCGGAVQGIREIPLSSEENEGIYLNRANDGFLFLDDGIYSCGPIEWKETDLFMSNFALSETSRLLVTAELTSPSECTAVAPPPSSGMFLRKTFGGSEDPVPEMEEMDPTSMSVEFSKTIRCLMPSAGQPWMLQRAKWEKDMQETIIPLDSADPSETLKYWTISQSTLEFSEWSGTIPSLIEGHVVHAGVLCESSRVVKSIARTYDESNSLKSVSFLEGCVL